MVGVKLTYKAKLDCSSLHLARNFDVLHVVKYNHQFQWSVPAL